MRRHISALIILSFARMRSRRVFRCSWNLPWRVLPQMKVKPQEVEGLRLAEPAPLAAFRRKASELDEPGLLGGAVSAQTSVAAHASRPGNAGRRFRAGSRR